jgi:hypothetical protein
MDFRMRISDCGKNVGEVLVPSACLIVAAPVSDAILEAASGSLTNDANTTDDKWKTLSSTRC